MISKTDQEMHVLLADGFGELSVVSDDEDTTLEDLECFNEGSK